MATRTGFEPVVSGVTGQRIRPTMLTCQYLVPRAGIEPALLAETDFKSVVYTYFTTEAWYRLRDSNSLPPRS